MLRAVHGMGRRVHGAARLVRQSIVRALPEPTVGLPVLPCDFLGVLDGRTLNLHAWLPETTTGPPERVELIFFRRRSTVRVPLTPVRGADGRWEVESLVRLDPGVGPPARTTAPGIPGVSLAAGIWSVGLALHGENGDEQRYALRAPETPAERGPTLRTPPHPTSGRHYLPDPNSEGLSRIRVEEPRIRAEVTRLHIGPADAAVHGRLVGVRWIGSPTVVFTARADDRAVEVPTEVSGEHFRAQVPLTSLATGPLGAEVFWDVWVRTPVSGAIRLGRFLHDLREPRQVFSAGRTTLALSGDDYVGYRPYYTAAGNLAISCIRFAKFTGE